MLALVARSNDRDERQKLSFVIKGAARRLRGAHCKTRPACPCRGQNPIRPTTGSRDARNSGRLCRPAPDRWSPDSLPKNERPELLARSFPVDRITGAKRPVGIEIARVVVKFSSSSPSRRSRNPAMNTGQCSSSISTSFAACSKRSATRKPESELDAGKGRDRWGTQTFAPGEFGEALLRRKCELRLKNAVPFRSMETTKQGRVACGQIFKVNETTVQP